MNRIDTEGRQASGGAPPSPAGSAFPLGFIVGTGRSGTTLTAQILNSHRLLCVPPELQILHSYDDNGRRFLEAYHSGEALQWRAEEFIQAVKEMCPYDLESFFDYPTFFRGLTYPQRSLGKLLQRFYRAIAAAKGKAYLLEQTPWYGQRLDVVHQLFPATKILHLVRDGRDVAQSFSRTPWWHDSVELNLSRWAREARKIRHDGRRCYGADNYLEVRYEDLVAEPRATLETITSFLGLDYEEALLDPGKMTDYYRDSGINSPSYFSAAFNRWRQKKRQVIFPDSAFAWKRTAPDKFRSLDPDVAFALQEFGYSA